MNKTSVPPVKDNNSELVAYQLSLSGKVQGVGFRPAIYRLARSLDLAGSVSNNNMSAQIHIQGAARKCQQFINGLESALPPAAKIDELKQLISTPKNINLFTIETSCTDSDEPSEIPVDLALCQECVSELFNPESRRYLYPFINCVDCGPRFSVLNQLPYDRDNTSWRDFPPCPNCLHEYKDESDRRFHAQGNCCASCGPRYTLCDNQGKPIDGSPIKACVDKIKQGKIVAIKGLSGFHLICDANHQKAIATLRQRKQRPDKPFAMMALNIQSLQQWVKIDKVSAQLLESKAAPIVLLPKNEVEKSALIAPNISDLGCILPYAPIHYLLFFHFLSQPAHPSWLNDAHNARFVLTSANQSGQSMHHDNAECISDLNDVADYFLMHNRDITHAIDDSVIQSGEPIAMIRRARGFAPNSINLENQSNTGTSSLAFGAHLKNTFCLRKGNKAYLSPHIGELSSRSQLDRSRHLLDAYQHFTKQSFQHAQDILLNTSKDKNDTIICDLHPDYSASVTAKQYANQLQLPLKTVQHHHAHFGAAMAEYQHSRHEAALGLILDGTGLGTDQTIWGGELFEFRHGAISRLGHFEQISLPGGDKASKEIWRIGAALLHRIEPKRVSKHYQAYATNALILNYLTRSQHIQCSSAGRWFDAIASLIGLRQVCTFEAQAAMELEALAASTSLPESESLIEIEDRNLMISPLAKRLLELENPIEAAAIFHRELIDGLVRWVESESKRRDCTQVYASGGCFQNRILREGLNQGLIDRGITVYSPQVIPVNDGGISLGQAWLGQ